MNFRATVLTLYPDMFPGPLGMSLSGDALQRGLWSLDIKNIRDHGIGKHRTVDDTPAGGGAGMVLRCDVVADALESVSAPCDDRPRIFLSPRGRPLTQQRVRLLSEGPGTVLLCGRFEGLDQRAIDALELEEISIGDYILSGGELGAMVLLDACVRLIPGVMGKSESGTVESFENGLLEYPQYTRPRVWRDMQIPDVLLSGDHAKIEAWRQELSARLTQQRRPDLLRK